MKWEYKIVALSGVRAEDQKFINELGGEGWELVAIEPSDHPGCVPSAYLKRQSSEEKAAAKESMEILKWLNERESLQVCIRTTLVGPAVRIFRGHKQIGQGETVQEAVAESKLNICPERDK